MQEEEENYFPSNNILKKSSSTSYAAMRQQQQTSSVHMYIYYIEDDWRPHKSSKEKEEIVRRIGQAFVGKEMDKKREKEKIYIDIHIS